MDSQENGSPFQRWIASFIFGAVFTLFGSMVLLINIYESYHGLTSVSWPHVEGIILESKVMNGGSGDNYYPYVVYKYRIDAQEYGGTKIAFGPPTFSKKTLAQRIVEKYEVGKSAKVYHHSMTHSLSVLQPGLNISWFAWTRGTAFLFIGVVLLYDFFESKKRPKNEPQTPQELSS